MLYDLLTLAPGCLAIAIYIASVAHFNQKA